MKKIIVPIIIVIWIAWYIATHADFMYLNSEELKELHSLYDQHKTTSVKEVQLYYSTGKPFGTGTLLHEAAALKSLNIIKYLVEKRGADVNAIDSDGKTPLHKAAWQGRIDAVKYLVSKGANVNYRALHSAKDGYSFMKKSYGDNFARSPGPGPNSAGFWEYEAVIEYLISEGAVDK